MRTRSSFNLLVVSSNPSTSNPKRRNCRRSKQPFILEESPIDTMADQRTMAELLCAFIEGYAEAIVVPPILVDQFELKHSLINMMTTNQYNDLLRAFPHHGFTELHQLDTFYNALNPADQDSLNAAAGGNLLERRTQDVLMIIKNKSKVHNFQNKSIVSQVKSCDANSNSSSEIAKLTHAVNQDNIQGYVLAAPTNYNQGNSDYRPPSMANQIRPAGFAQPNVQNNQNRFGQPQGFNRGNNFNPEQSYQAPTQQNQNVPFRSGSLPSNTVANLKGELKAITTRSGLVIDEPTVPTTFINPEKDERIKETLTDLNLAEYTIKVPPPPVKKYKPPAVTIAMTAILKQFQATPPPASVKAVEEICVTCGGAHLYYQCLAVGGNTFPELGDNIQGYVSAAAVNYNQGNFVYRPPGSRSLPSNTVANPNGELKAITTRSGIVLDGPTVPPTIINPEVDELVEETLTDSNLSEYTIKKLPKKLEDPGKFLIPCGFSELKCKALADLGASINLMPLSVWKKLGLPELISTRMTLELANRAICTPAGIARDVFVSVGRFTFPADFVIVDYESDPKIPLILARPFLRTTRALIDVHESINLINVFNNSSEDFLEDLFSNHPSGNPTFSSHPELTSSEVKDIIFDLEGGNVLPKKLLDLDSTKDLQPPLHDNPLSGSTTYSYSSNPLLEEFADELALITFPPKYDDDLQFDIESDLKEIEFLLYRDIDSSFKDSIDQSNLVNLVDNFVDSMPEMFTDEHALDYSSPLIFDEYDDDFLEVESDTENVYDDPFDSKGEKIKESKLLIDELDLPCDFLPFEYDSFISQDFYRVDALPSTNNEDKVFNPGILIQEKPFEIITRVVQDKKLATSNASLVLEDFDPPFYEPLFFKEVPSIPGNLKTHAEGFCPPVFISSTSLGNNVFDGVVIVILGYIASFRGLPVEPRWENDPGKLGDAPNLAFQTMTLQETNWNMDTRASSHLAGNTGLPDSSAPSPL
nr:reverse transcriptase domain-containing protein [Tanacetum cinerariifolium]